MDCSLNHIPNAGLVDGNEALIVHGCEKPHDELAVHAVCDAAVAGDRLSKILDFECPFEPRGKKATEGSDQRGESREHENVHLHWGDGDGGCGKWDGMWGGDEDRVGDAGEAG